MSATRLHATRLIARLELKAAKVGLTKAEDRQLADARRVLRRLQEKEAER